MAQKNQAMWTWGVVVPKKFDDIVVEAVEKSTFNTKSAFIRDSVRKRLVEMGFKI